MLKLKCVLAVQSNKTFENSIFSLLIFDIYKRGKHCVSSCENAYTTNKLDRKWEKSVSRYICVVCWGTDRSMRDIWMDSWNRKWRCNITIEVDPVSNCRLNYQMQLVY